MQETGQIRDCGFYLPVSMSRDHPVLETGKNSTLEEMGNRHESAGLPLKKKEVKKKVRGLCRSEELGKEFPSSPKRNTTPPSPGHRDILMTSSLGAPAAPSIYNWNFHFFFKEKKMTEKKDRSPRDNHRRVVIKNCYSSKREKQNKKRSV